MLNHFYRCAPRHFPAASGIPAIRQQGAVLIVCLLILLVMTVTGVTGLQVTSLEEKMSGNMRDRNLAFQAAESALRRGENFLAVNTTSAANFTCISGLYPEKGGGCDSNSLIDVSSSNQVWDNIDWSVAASSVCMAGLAELSAQPCYIIERLAYTSTGTSPTSGGSLEVGVPAGAGATESWYRVTARAAGGSANAVVFLQSIYKK
jgi:type IV pilus assembly protein PilX